LPSSDIKRLQVKLGCSYCRPVSRFRKPFFCVLDQGSAIPERDSGRTRFFFRKINLRRSLSATWPTEAKSSERLPVCLIQDPSHKTRDLTYSISHCYNEGLRRGKRLSGIEPGGKRGVACNGSVACFRRHVQRLKLRVHLQCPIIKVVKPSCGGLRQWPPRSGRKMTRLRAETHYTRA
jgi:hypothetical protein